MRAVVGVTAVGALIVGSLAATSDTGRPNQGSAHSVRLPGHKRAQATDLVGQLATAGCSARDFVLMGKASHAPGAAQLGGASVYVTQRIRNSGADCVLELPKTIQAVNAKGVGRVIQVLDTGYAMSFHIPHDGTATLVIGAWWPISGLKGVRSVPCHDAITDVTKVAIPFGEADLRIALGTVWREACKSPGSTSIEITSRTLT